MTSPFLFYAAAAGAVLTGLAAVIRKRDSISSWSFCLSMLLLAAETLFKERSLSEAALQSPATHSLWHRSALLAGAILPLFWLCFSLTFFRGNHRDFLKRWQWILAAALIPPVLAVLDFDGLVRFVEVKDTAVMVPTNGPTARLLVLSGLVTSIAILMNVEATFRAAVGTARWRIKHMALGIAVLMGTRVYTLSQTLLFPLRNTSMAALEAGALLVACGLMAIGYSRQGLTRLEVYPSRAVLQQSAAAIIAGAYLLIVGVLAELVSYLGGFGSFPAQAFMVLLGLSGLAVLFLSDRYRSAMGRFITRHFKRPQLDFRKVWSRFSLGLSDVTDRATLCSSAAQLIAQTFDVLSVTIFLLDRHREQLEQVFATSSGSGMADPQELDAPDSAKVMEAMRHTRHPLNLEKIHEPWARSLRELLPNQFSNGGPRMMSRLAAGENVLGLVVLADRFNGLPHTQEELDLLQCIAEEIGARLLNKNLGDELIQAREMQAFQAMSAFFVHDMKNAAATLRLTLQNLPLHYDNAEFREDTLRGLAKTADRICQLTERLASLRQNLDLNLQESDLNQIVLSVLEEIRRSAPPGIELATELQLLPPLRMDPDQIRNVVTNLLLNALEATGKSGTILLRTSPAGGRVQCSVRDSGCGMTKAFIKTSLFRPFHSTKKQGLGIGLYQSRMIVELHSGTMQVESEPSQGTTFRFQLPVNLP